MEQPQMCTEDMQQLLVSSDVYLQWCHVGQTRGLQSDTQIATFLLQQFHQVKETKPSQSYLCVFCNTPLPSTCSQCTALTGQNGGSSAEVQVFKDNEVLQTILTAQSQGHIQQTDHVVQDSSFHSTADTAAQHKGKSFSCRDCGASFTTASSLSRHGRKFHSGDTNETGAITDSDSKLPTSGEEEMELQDENDDDAQLSVLFQSEEIDPNWQPSKSKKPKSAPPKKTKFLCQICGGIYASKGSLKYHMRAHDGIKPYTCPDCPRAFNYSSHLTRHRRVHSGERPYLCTQCGATFTQKNDLNQHMHRHSGVKPFMCSHCGKWCSTAGDLRIHMVSHSDKRPFRCKECGVSFARESSRVKHMRTHTGEKPFKCKDCGVAYSDSSTLRRHRQRKHEEGMSRKSLHF